MTDYIVSEEWLQEMRDKAILYGAACIESQGDVVVKRRDKMREAEAACRQRSVELVGTMWAKPSTCGEAPRGCSVIIREQEAPHD